MNPVTPSSDSSDAIILRTPTSQAVHFILVVLTTTPAPPHTPKVYSPELIRLRISASRGAALLQSFVVVASVVAPVGALGKHKTAPLRLSLDLRMSH
jgi:hypothetical protein